jgi:hypothetical protein
MTGKFLPYKYYGATGNALAYGLIEEQGATSFALNSEKQATNIGRT